MGVSWLGILVLLASGAGSAPRDLVSFVDAEDYFRTRGVVLKAEEIAGLVTKEPTDGKAQISQLLAIRWLAIHPIDVKKADGARSALEAVAQGKKAQDPSGFAKDYAQRALAKLDGKILPAPTGPRKDTVTESLKWFPDTVTLVASVDLRGTGEAESLEVHPMSGLLTQILGPKQREEFYRFADAVGNIRLDRAALALQMGLKGAEPERIYARLTGLSNAKRLIDFLHPLVTGGKLTEEKGLKGEPVLILASREHAPAIAVIGDTELIVAGYQKEAADHVEVLRQVLSVRAGKSPNVTAGPLKDLLKDVPGRAAAVLAGELNDDQRTQLTMGDNLFRAAPQRLAANLAHDKGVAVQLRAMFKDAAEAMAFVDSVDKLKKQAAEMLKNPPPRSGITADMAKLLTRMLNDFQLVAKDAEAKGSLSVPPETVKALRDMIGPLLGHEPDSPPKGP